MPCHCWALIRLSLRKESGFTCRWTQPLLKGPTTMTPPPTPTLILLGICFPSGRRAFARYPVAVAGAVAHQKVDPVPGIALS